VDVTGDYTSNVTAAMQRREINEREIVGSISGAEAMLRRPAEHNFPLDTWSNPATAGTKSSEDPEAEEDGR